MLKIITFTLILTCLFPYAVWSNYQRNITNDSNSMWIIINRPDHKNSSKVQFDSNGPGACQRESVLANGPCFLPPHRTTEVTYVELVGGELVLTNMHENVFVSYHPSGGDGLWMDSTNAKRVNDDHGNLKIFR